MLSSRNTLSLAYETFSEYLLASRQILKYFGFALKGFYVKQEEGNIPEDQQK